MPSSCYCHACILAGTACTLAIAAVVVAVCCICSRGIEVQQQLCNVLVLIIDLREMGEACCCLLHHCIDQLPRLSFCSCSSRCLFLVLLLLVLLLVVL